MSAREGTPEAAASHPIAWKGRNGAFPSELVIHVDFTLWTRLYTVPRQPSSGGYAATAATLGHRNFMHTGGGVRQQAVSTTIHYAISKPKRLKQLAYIWCRAWELRRGVGSWGWGVPNCRH
jgi:hypothetical protein